MAVLKIWLTLFSVSIACTSGFLFHETVCYKPLGCFKSNDPFNNALGETPDSPDDIKVKSYLWTKQNPVTAQQLDYTDSGTITGSNFNSGRPTKILIHGFMSSKDASPVIANLSVALLKTGDYNVIGIDWREGARQFYPKAVANTRVVGAVVSHLVQTLQSKAGLKLSDLHVIGHSLGAHTAGYVGRRNPGIAQITGLDPAGPMFTRTDVIVRLDATDAQFVDVIHSDAAPLEDAGFGTLQRMGHLDFYPNGGQIQPGCPPPVKTTLEKLLEFKLSDAFESVACAHDRAIWYFIASILETGCKFEAHPCQDWSTYQTGNCSSCGDAPCPIMGVEAINTPAARGAFYLKTNSQSPFCMNQ